MTLSDYAAAVTEKLIEMQGPNFVHPDSFDHDIQTYFMRRTEINKAAAKIIEDMEAE